MIADKSRRPVLGYALLAVRIIALGLAPNAVPIPDKHMVLSIAQVHQAHVRQVGCSSVPRPAQPHKQVHDPFESMLLG
jgi:hypothetical protein